MSWQEKSINFLYKTIITLLVLVFIFGALFIAAVVTTPISKADPVELGFFLKSKHFVEGDFNETNPGIYVIKDDIFLGVVKNSYSDTTYLVGYNLSLYKVGPIELSYLYGLVYGYGWNDGYSDADIDGVRLLPYILPTVSISVMGIKINTHHVGNGLAWSVSYLIK